MQASLLRLPLQWLGAGGGAVAMLSQESEVQVPAQTLTPTPQAHHLSLGQQSLCGPGVLLGQYDSDHLCRLAKALSQ